MIDQLELLFWSQGGLQDDDVVTPPGVTAGLRRTECLDRNAEPRGGCAEALREQEFVLDEKQFPGHGCRIAPDRDGQSLSHRQKRLGACYNRARESWVEGNGVAPAKPLRSKDKTKEIRRELQRQDFDVP